MRILLLISLFLLNACTRAPEIRRVQIESIPSGAVVWVDGAEVGITPLAIEVAGDRIVQLRLAMRGHEDWTMRLDPNSTPKLLAPLVPEPRGSIDFGTTPPGAEVTLNGERRGQTPIILPNLVPGSYEIRCQLENFEPHVETIDISDSETVKREVTLVDKLVNFYQAQIDVEEAPQTLTSYTDLAHQLFVTGRTEEACATLLDGLMEMYRRKTKDARLVAELDRTLAGQYFREGTRDEIRAQIVGQLRERFGLIQEPNAKDLRAFIMVLVYLKEKEVAKTELETAVAFFPEDEGIRELQREVLDEIEPPPLTPAEAVERERIIALFKEMRIEYSRSKAQMDRSRRAASQAEAALKKIHKRRESAADEGKELRAALADLRPELEKFEFELQSLEEAKARIVANPDKLSYQELRGAMSEIAERIRDAESTAATSRSEAERLEAAIADNQDFVKNYKTIEAEARKAIASTAAEVPEAEAAFKEVSVRYEKMRKKHYDIVYKKKKK